jgi:NADPH:quinone reductase-like Zn-dependent oxidoreductase
MTKPVKDASVVVIGGTSGIGLATAQLAGAAGAA